MFCKGGVLEGFADFTEKHMCRNLFFSERESLTQVFSCGFRGIFWGAFFIEYFGATASVTKNTGASNKQHQITANMADLTTPMFSFICIAMPTRL